MLEKMSAAEAKGGLVICGKSFLLMNFCWDHGKNFGQKRL